MKKAAVKKAPRLTPVVPKAQAKLSPVWRLTQRTALLFWRHKQNFIGITLIYGLLIIILAQGLANADVSRLKAQLSGTNNGPTSIGSSLTILASLVGSSSSPATGAAGAYQFFIGLIASLAIIWALRQTSAGTVFKIRDAFYRGMSPLIPFVLILLFIGLQLLPIAIGSALYGIVITQGIAVNGFEKTVAAVVFGGLVLASLYSIASSIFALYIVTLPDMTPLKALRSAKQLVKGRRWTALRKILFLPLVLLVLGSLIMVPFIIWAAPAAKYVFFILSVTSLVAVHGYLYNLYRELLDA